MKKIFLPLFSILIFSVFATIKAQDCSDLFFSEYVEGSSQNKAIEIYNPTDHVISLVDYVIKRYKNGQSTPDTQLLLYQPDSGVTEIQPHDVLIICNGQIIPNEYGSVSDSLWNLSDLHGTGNHSTCPMYFNGNDAMTLEKISDYSAVDLFGKIGMGAEIETAEGWTNVTDTTIVYYDSLGNQYSEIISNYVVPLELFWMSWTSDHSLVRKPSVKKGVTSNPSLFNVGIEWDTLPGGQDNWSNLGFHVCDCFLGTNTPISKKHEVYFFPNPIVDDNVYLKATGIIKEAEILDITGKVVKSQSNTERRGDMHLYFNKLQQGIYLARVTFDDNTVYSQKLIVK